ncbi:bifunctional folylpolyglutamate synthase/dihydrofolate synthase, partial [Candidatus Woesearchaeota archaeon]|nr:bifunctional folylpolyglutamate synthase/dihydrofolate synthase [Candidatus Woesearchaeota archaeon]
YKKILKYLYSLESPKIKLGLDRIQGLLGKIGNPEKELKCIHVAGTNGKGSVCAMIFCILKEAGYKVGLYTSPHLKRFNERIRVNGHFITDKEIVEYFLKVKPFITNQSFFEITTAMAFLNFREKNVDFAVLEVGLGGRLDATNVAVPLVSAITNIGIEHTELLGKTIEKIAFEKAGIIKNNVPVVTGAKGRALEVIKKIARQRNAPLFLAKKYKNIKFGYLNGNFQQKNKDIALTTINIFKKYNQIKINGKQIMNGIKKTKWQGRLEFVSKNVLVDCAHNPSGFAVLKKELSIIKKQKNIKNFIFVVGMQNDKDIPIMLKTIKPLISTIIFTKSKNEKAAKPEDLLKNFNKLNQNKQIQIKIIENPKKALKYAKKISGKKDLIVVTGSIYLVGEVV